MPPPFAARAEWKVTAISSAVPADFARQLEEHLNFLSKEGFQMMNMAERGDAVIITAIRMAQLPPPPSALSGQVPPPPPPPATRSRAEKKLGFAASDPKGVCEERIIYKYLDTEHNEVREKVFDTLWQAASFALSDIKYMSDEDAFTVLPISIIHLQATTFEPGSFADLAQTSGSSPTDKSS